MGGCESKFNRSGVPAVAQWVKNPTAAAPVTDEAWIQSLAQELPYARSAAKKETKKLTSFLALLFLLVCSEFYLSSVVIVLQKFAEICLNLIWQ